MKHFWGKKRWRQKNAQTWTAFLDTFLKKKSAHSLLVHGHSSWSIFGLHLLRGPKALWIDDVWEIGPWMLGRGKRQSSMARFQWTGPPCTLDCITWSMRGRAYIKMSCFNQGRNFCRPKTLGLFILYVVMEEFHSCESWNPNNKCE